MVKTKKHFLMCPPDYFDIEYEINPWMDKTNPVKAEVASAQWHALYDLYEKLGYELKLIRPEPGLPDMVFTANGGLVINGRDMLPRFKYRERQPETALFANWFAANGLETRLPDHDFEGEGDALVCGEYILAGWGFRSDRESHAELRDYFDRPVISLHLINPNFYHLDTALAILDAKTVAYYPGAFDESSQRALELAVPNIIRATASDAEGFGLNAVSNGHDVVISDRAKHLGETLEKAGFRVHLTPITEFRKSGGGVKCLTLELRK